MDKYDDSTVVTTLPAVPAAGPNKGYFIDEVVPTQKPTVLRAWYMNALMLEIYNVIVFAGITPARNVYTQLLSAIQALVASAGYLTQSAGDARYVQHTAFTQAYESAPQSFSAGTAISLAHGLGTTPKLSKLVLRCVTAELGYSIGDEVEANPNLSETGGGPYSPVDVNFQLVANATSIVVVPAAGGGNVVAPFAVYNRTAGSVGVLANITTANWRAVVRCWV